MARGENLGQMPDSWHKRRYERQRARQRQVMIYKIIIGIVLVFVVGLIVFAAVKLRKPAGDGAAVETTESIADTEAESLEETMAETVAETPVEPMSEAAAETPVAETAETQAETTAAPPETTAAATTTASNETIPRTAIADVKEFLNIRKTTSQTADVIDMMPSGASCQILRRDGEWYYVRYKNSEGYVVAKYLK